MPITKPERQLRKTAKGVWVDAASDATVGYGETLIAEAHRVKVLAGMDSSDPVIRAAKTQG